jgi:hypothetical protein
MTASPPPATSHDQHDSQALMCSLLQRHLFPSLDQEDKLAVRGVSVQLREEADRCLRSLCLLGTLKTEQGIQSLLALLSRVVGLSSLTLGSLEAVCAVFSEDGSHACGPWLKDLAIRLSKVSASVPRRRLHGTRAAWGPRSCARLVGWEPRCCMLHAPCSDPSLSLPCRMKLTR